MFSVIEEIKQLIHQSGAEVVSVAVSDLNKEHTILVNPNLSFHPASTFKICVMMEVFHQAQQSLFSLDDGILVKNKFQSIVDQSPFSLSITDDSETNLHACEGRAVPIRDLVIRMITQSSNLATNILIELVTPRKVNEYMRELGAEGLMVRRGVEDNKAFELGLNNAATAKALMTILVKLALHQVVSPDASEAMLAIMKDQRHNEGIPSLLPAGIPIAHKTGWIENLYHDAAIVYPHGRDPYVVVIMTSGLSDVKEAYSLVASLSKLIFDCQNEWH